MTERIDSIVVGAGVVGLAVARALAQAGRDVVVLERAEAIGTVTSSRNSEVIHAGIYYPTGSLKARLCVAGRRALSAYCRERGIGHRACGKLIVATDAAGVPALHALAEKARANGVEGLEMLDAGAARAMEPALACTAALHSPVTGILDSHAFMLSLQGDAEAAGAMVAFHAPVEAIAAGPVGLTVEVGGAEPMALTARLVVNAAGHDAPVLAVDPRPSGGGRAAPVFRQGHLFLPDRPLAVLVPDLSDAGGRRARRPPDARPGRAGAVRADRGMDGPARRLRGSIGPAPTPSMQRSRKYWPDLPDRSLVPGYVGVRPKLQAPGEPARGPFEIQGPGRPWRAGTGQPLPASRARALTAFARHRRRGGGGLGAGGRIRRCPRRDGHGLPSATVGAWTIGSRSAAQFQVVRQCRARDCIARPAGRRRRPKPALALTAASFDSAARRPPPGRWSPPGPPGASTAPDRSRDGDSPPRAPLRAAPVPPRRRPGTGRRGRPGKVLK